ncbi:MAG: patatin-like phospholipase family protein [Steroidobacteraceae bacterium]
MPTALETRISTLGQKKILACDGGGIMGLMSVEILARIETELRLAFKNPQLVLADYFDFVCGTSTGAIIAACISAGMSMDTIRTFYVDSGADMFDRASLAKRLRYDYNSEPLALKLREVFTQHLGNDTTLGSSGLRTLLMTVLRNATTDSPWPVWNNPHAKFNQRERKDCNLNLPLWQLVRASTAAPTYFPPEVVTFAPNTPDEYSFIFVDGGVTTYNNPAFLAFQMATAKPYALNWSVGAQQLLIVSVGTGGTAKARPNLQANDLWLLDNAKNVPAALMNAASAGWDMACRTLGECRHGAAIDSEYGDMVCGADACNWSGAKLFTYMRYDPDVSAAGLQALGLGSIDPAHVQLLDSVQYIPEIQRVGQVYAEKHVAAGHFRGFV